MDGWCVISEDKEVNYKKGRKCLKCIVHDKHRVVVGGCLDGDIQYTSAFYLSATITVSRHKKLVKVATCASQLLSAPCYSILSCCHSLAVRATSDCSSIDLKKYY